MTTTDEDGNTAAIETTIKSTKFNEFTLITRKLNDNKKKLCYKCRFTIIVCYCFNCHAVAVKIGGNEWIFTSISSFVSFSMLLPQFHHFCVKFSANRQIYSTEVNKQKMT